MPTETLHFENARVAQQLFANEPKNLDALESSLGVKAASRDGWIKLDGETANLERAKNLFQILETSVRAGTPVRTRDFARPAILQHRENRAEHEKKGHETPFEEGLFHSGVHGESEFINDANGSRLRAARSIDAGLP